MEELPMGAGAEKKGKGTCGTTVSMVGIVGIRAFVIGLAHASGMLTWFVRPEFCLHLSAGRENWEVLHVSMTSAFRMRAGVIIVYMYAYRKEEGIYDISFFLFT